MWRSLAAGVLISVACFVLLFWGVGYLLVLLPRYQGSSWFQPALNAFVIFSVTAGALVYRRKHSRVKKAPHR
jgi:hypothetical protein